MKSYITFIIILCLSIASFAQIASIESVRAVANDTEPTGIEHEDIGIYPNDTTTDKSLDIGASKTETEGVEHEDNWKEPTTASVDYYVKIPDIDGESDESNESIPTALNSHLPLPSDGGVDIPDVNKTRSGYVKIGDIKGESESEDNPDDELRKPEPAATDYFLKIKGIDGESKSSKDMVLKGKKILQNSKTDPVLKVSTVEELEEFVVAATENDEQIEEVTFTYEKIKFDYKQPAKLFGLFDVEYTLETTVEENRVKVKYPWWVRLSRNNAEDTIDALEEELSTLGEDAQLANIDMQNKLQHQQRQFQTISNVMKSQHDTAMAVIRKTS